MWVEDGWVDGWGGSVCVCVWGWGGGVSLDKTTLSKLSFVPSENESTLNGENLQ